MNSKLSKSEDGSFEILNENGTKTIFRKSADAYVLDTIEDRYGNTKRFISDLSSDDALIVFDETNRQFKVDLYERNGRFLPTEFREHRVNAKTEYYTYIPEYYDNGQLKTITSTHGERIYFTYDQLERITAVFTQDDLVPQLEFIYEGNSYQIKEIIEEGEFKHTFSSTGTKTTYTDNHNITTEYEFYSDKPLLKEVAVKGSPDLITKFEFDDEHRLTKADLSRRSSH